jgi:hypothetical protein
MITAISTPASDIDVGRVEAERIEQEVSMTIVPGRGYFSNHPYRHHRHSHGGAIHE